MSTHDALVDIAESRFKDSSNNIISAAEWSEYLNTCYQFVNAATPFWPWLEAQATTVTIAAGTDNANLPTDSLTVQSVVNATDDWPMFALVGRRQQASIYDAENADTGQPVSYRLVGSKIYVYPKAEVETTLNVEYLVGTAAISGTTEPVWPEMYHRILVTGMLSLAYGDDGNPKEAERRWAMFEKEVGQMMKQVLSVRTEGYAEIEDTWYGR